jgi:branched-chain amino acid transport system substrate-binding protein
MRIILRFIVVISVLGFLLVASATGVFGKETNPEWYTIGTIATRTGVGAAWGITLYDGLMSQFQIINDRGGITIGGKRYLLKTKNEEDKYSAAGGRAAVEKLIFREKVKFLIGPISSSSAAAVAPIVEKNKVIMFPVCSTPKVFNAMVFKAHLPSSIMARQFVTIAAKTKKFSQIKRWAWLMADDETGHATYDWAMMGMKDLLAKEPERFEKLTTKWFPRGTVDFVPQLTAILRENPDIIDVSGAVSEEEAMIIKQAREMGYSGWIWAGAPSSPVELAQAAGSKNVYKVLDAGYYIHPDIVVKISPEYKALYDKYVAQFGSLNELAKKYTEMFGKEADLFAPSGMMIAAVMIQGILAADSFDTEKVAAAMEAMPKVCTPYGVGTWGGKGEFGVAHQLFPPTCMSEMKGDKRVWIDIMEVPSMP